ncbi:hypothetical protein [Micromonospora sp. NBC_00421]|uniref:hypothetical protein n=1 Tax=Micromonospora sp. NBC_00421 TaxID=2975976 RepID=UPI002E1EA31A
MARFVMGSAWVDVHADTRQLRPEVRRAAADLSRDTQISVRTTLDTSGADGDRARLKAKIDRTGAQMRVGVDDRDVGPGVDRAGSRIKSAFERVGADVGQVLSRAVSGGMESGAAAATSGGGALLGILGSLAAGAATLTVSALALVPALQMVAGGFGVALGGGIALVSLLGTVVLAFGGVFEALQAHSAMQDQAVASGARLASQELSNSIAIRNATEAIGDARRRQARTVADVADRIADSERRVAEAAARASDAQQRLNDVRAEAVKRINDLAKAARDAAGDESQAELDLAGAKERLRVIESHLAMGDGVYTDLQRQQALLDIKRATDELTDAQETAASSQAAATAAAKAGVEGDKQVVAARKAAEAAAQDAVDAERALTRAKRDGARAQEDANIAVARAVRGLSDLQRQQAEQARSSTQASAAATKWAQAYGELTPAGRRFVDQLISMQGHLDDLKATAQDATLPGVTSFLRDADTRFPQVNKHIAAMGGIVGGIFRRLGQYIRTPLFGEQFTRILGSVERFTASLGNATTTALPALITLTDEASPLLEAFGGWIERGATKFADWIESARKSGALTDFFRDVRKTFADVSDIGGLVFGIIGDLIGIVWDPSKDANSSVLGGVKSMLTDIKVWLDDDGNKDKLRGWITDIKGTAGDLAHDVLPALRTAAGLVSDAIQWVGDHPAATAALISVLAGYKALSGLTGLKLPDLAKAALGALLQRGNTRARPLFVEVVGGMPGPGGGPGPDGDPPGGRRVQTALEVLGGITAASLAVDTILGKPGASLGGFKALLMGPESYSEWSKENAPAFQRFFSMTLPGWLTAGGERGWSSFKDAFINTFGDEAAHWFSITLPNSINLGEGQGGWAGLANNLGRWFGETLPGSLSPGEGKGWSGLVGDTERWFSHTLPDAINLGEGSGWSGLKEDLGNWFGQTLPDALSPGSGGGWKGAGKRWRDQSKDLLGINLAAGLWDGFTSKWESLYKSVDSFIVDNIGGRFRSGFGRMATGVRNAFTNPFSLLPNALMSPMESLRSFFNTVIGKINLIIPDQFDIKSIPKFESNTLTPFASGGRVVGPGTGTSDDVPILASNGEYVLRAAAVSRLGLPFVDRMNQADRVDIGGDPSAMRLRFADGGLISKTQQFIRGTDPLPYVWGNVGPGSYDCSGLVGEVWARLTGHPSYRRYFTTANVAGGGFGWRPGHGTYTIGLSDSHVVGNLAGLAFEAASSRSGIKVGANARSVDAMPRQYFLPEMGGSFVGGGGGSDGGWWARTARTALNTALRPLGVLLDRVLPDDQSVNRAGRGVALASKDALVDRVASYDSGGPLYPGWTLAHNGTGRTETVRTSGQEADLEVGGYQVHYHLAEGAIRITIDPAGLREIEDVHALLSDVQRIARATVGSRAVRGGRR